MIACTHLNAARQLCIFGRARYLWSLCRLLHRLKNGSLLQHEQQQDLQKCHAALFGCTSSNSSSNVVLQTQAATASADAAAADSSKVKHVGLGTVKPAGSADEETAPPEPVTDAAQQSTGTPAAQQVQQSLQPDQAKPVQGAAATRVPSQLSGSALADCAHALLEHECTALLPAGRPVWVRVRTGWCAATMLKAYDAEDARRSAAKCSVKPIAAGKSKLTVTRSQLRPRACPDTPDAAAVQSSEELHAALRQQVASWTVPTGDVDDSMIASLAASLFPKDDNKALAAGTEVWAKMSCYALQQLLQQQTHFAALDNVQEAGVASADSGGCAVSMATSRRSSRRTSHVSIKFAEPPDAQSAVHALAEGDEASESTTELPFMLQPSLAEGATAAQIHSKARSPALDLAVAGSKGSTIDAGLSLTPAAAAALQGASSMAVSNAQNADISDARHRVGPDNAHISTTRWLDQHVSAATADSANFVLAMHNTDSGDAARLSARQRAAKQRKFQLADLLANDRDGRLAPRPVWVRARVWTPASKADIEPAVQLLDQADHAQELFRVPRQLLRSVPPQHRRAPATSAILQAAARTPAEQQDAQKPGAFARFKALFSHSRSPSPGNGKRSAPKSDAPPAQEGPPADPADLAAQPVDGTGQEQPGPAARADVADASVASELRGLAAPSEGDADAIDGASLTLLPAAAAAAAPASADAIDGNTEPEAAERSGTDDAQPVAEAAEVPASDGQSEVLLNAAAPAVVPAVHQQRAQQAPCSSTVQGARLFKANTSQPVPHFKLIAYAHNGLRQLKPAKQVALHAHTAAPDDETLLLSAAEPIELPAVPQDICCVIVLELHIWLAGDTASAGVPACIGWTAVAPFCFLSPTRAAINSRAKPLPLSFQKTPGGRSVLDVCGILLAAMAHLPCAAEHVVSHLQAQAALRSMCNAAGPMMLSGQTAASPDAHRSATGTQATGVQVRNTSSRGCSHCETCNLSVQRQA